MKEQYQVIALMGKSAAGKDTLQRKLCKEHPELFHPIVSCTTRSPREKEIEGQDYYFISAERFTKLLLDGELIEATEFNNWFYGTPISSLSANKINVGVFNPAGIEALLSDNRLNVEVFEVAASDKLRLSRALAREDNPDCAEICRRYFADIKDFSDIDFDYNIIYNNNVGWFEQNDNLENVIQEMMMRLKAQNHSGKID